MASGNIKGITIQFAGDTTKLDKALREIKNSTKDIDAELKQVNKALKFNPTSVELWRQKQDLLQQKIKETENNLKELKNIQAQMDASGVDKNSEAYRRVSREIIEAESKLKTFNTELRKIGQVNLRAMSEQFKEMGTKLESAGRSMQGLSTAAAAVAASIGALTVKSGKWADDINTMSKVYSISTKDLQKYSAAAELVDVDVETIAKSHTKLEKQMLSASKGTGSAAEAFEKLGVNVTDSNGELRKGDEIWQETVKALGSMKNETERDALAMTLMGKSAAELNPLIEDGGKAYKELSDTLAKYDLDYIDQETLDQANAFNDSLDTIKAVGLVAFQQLGTQLASYLAPAMEKVVDLVGRIAGWFANLSPETQAIVAGIAAFVAVLSPLLIGLGKVSFAISSIISLFGTVGPVIAGLAGPIGIAVAVIAGLVAAGILLYKNWDKIKKFAKDLGKNLKKTWNEIKKSVSDAVNSLKTTVTNTWNTIKTTVTGIVTAIKTTITTTWDAIKAGVKSAVDAVRNTITSVFNAIKAFIQTTLDAWKNTITTAWTAIQTAVTNVVNAVKNVISTVFAAITTLIRTYLDGWKNIITTVWTAISTLTSNAVNGIRNVITSVFNEIKTFVTNVWNGIKTAITTAIDAAKTTVSNVVNNIKSTVTSVFNSVKSTVTTVWNGIKTAITTPIESAKSTVTSVIGTIKSTVSNAFGGLSGGVKKAFDAVKEAITKPINTAKDAVEKAVSTIKGIFPIKLGKIFSGIKLPHFKISGGKIPWGIGGKGTAPSISIDWYAKGGIFNSPSLIGVGEAGSEAVVPLDRFWKTLEGMSAGETNIVININGASKDPREIAEEVKRVLIRETNQRRLAWQ